MSIFKEDFTEEFINNVIEKSIRETLVITNPKSIQLAVEKVKGKLLSELEERRRRKELEEKKETKVVVENM